MSGIDFIFIKKKEAFFRVVSQKQKQKQKGTLIWLYSRKETEYIIQLCILFPHAEYFAWPQQFDCLLYEAQKLFKSMHEFLLVALIECQKSVSQLDQLFYYDSLSPTTQKRKLKAPQKCLVN